MKGFRFDLHVGYVRYVANDYYYVNINLTLFLNHFQKGIINLNNKNREFNIEYIIHVWHAVINVV